MAYLSRSVAFPSVPHCTITAEPIKIRWDPSLPVFAKEEFLRAVGDEYGWLGGIDESGMVRCVLPYTIIRKAGLRLVRFRIETIPCGAGLDVNEEKSFLNSVVQHFRDSRADVIIPASNNALFRTCPDGASPAPYGSYVIDLRQPEDALWKNMARGCRRDISSSQKSGVLIRQGMEYLDPAYDLIRQTFRRSKMGFMRRGSFKRFALALGQNGLLLLAEHQGVARSCSLFAFSNPCAYGIYAGNSRQQYQGAMKLIQWEAMRTFRNLGVRELDFFGARINPQKGSKQECINLMKEYLGARLVEGYMWKYSLRPWRALLYSLGVRVLRGGDIVDQEGPRLRGYNIKLRHDVAQSQVLS